MLDKRITTTSNYDINGNLIGINGDGEGQVAKRFINDTNGIILEQSTGNNASSSISSPTSLTRQIVANGQVWCSYGFTPGLGTLFGNTPQPAPAGYANLPSGMNVNTASFDANFQPINSGYPSPSVGNYLVRAGDTLQAIARANSALWKRTGCIALTLLWSSWRL